LEQNTDSRYQKARPDKENWRREARRNRKMEKITPKISLELVFSTKIIEIIKYLI
jgi:hypothetical protein